MTQQTQQKHIFVSYAREDEEFAQRLNKSLLESGQIPWQDRKNIKPGDNYQEKIDTALRDAEAVLVVMSPQAARSQYVTYEWAFAYGAGVRVIPVVVKKQTKLHPRLIAINYIDFTTRSGSPWVDLRNALMPALPSTMPIGPELRAKFSLDHGKPEQRGNYYVIDVYIHDPPPGAKQVTYEFLDETLKIRKWTTKSATTGFKFTILSNGETLLTASIRTPGKKKPLRIACPLFEALKFGHGSSPKPPIAKAIRKIGQSRTT